MYRKKRILALIPARGGSKGIKGKNIRNIGEKPLIAYTIEAALQSGCFDSVAVSTDNSEIAKISQQYGAEIPFLRPSILASDMSKTIEAVLHAKNELLKAGREFDLLVLLQPTQPLRTSDDIRGAIDLFFDRRLNSLVSVCPVYDHPILIRTMGLDFRLSKLLDTSSTVRRQDMPPFFRVNGAIYINYINNITLETSFNDNEYGYIMDYAHSIDIDSEADIKMAEMYLSQKDTLSRNI